MAIPDKDLKILWARAAGRCSMPECRKKLTEACRDLPSGHDVIGFSCHIVAEEPDGPRGDSSLTPEDRNRYPNLIVLCKAHHELVDQNPDAWPIERLHQAKADHEVWVESCLVEVQELKLRVFSDLVTAATEGLHLDRWPYVSDHAIRGFVLQSFVDGVDHLGEKACRAVWPKCYPQLKRAIEELADRAGAFTAHYMELATIRDDTFFAEDRAWKKRWMSQSEYQEFEDRSTQWRKEQGILLANLVHAINLFAEAVREYLNPRFFVYDGKFAIHDELGVTNRGEACLYVPDCYCDG
jgi:hypothetical protein